MIGDRALGERAAHARTGVHALASGARQGRRAVGTSIALAPAAARALIRVTFEARCTSACGSVALLTALGVGAARGWDARRAGGRWTDGACTN